MAVSLVHQLRNNGFKVDMSYGDRALKGAMKAADRSGAKYAVLLGESELNSAQVQVKDLTSSSQTDVPLDKVVEFFSNQAKEG